MPEQSLAASPNASAGGLASLYADKPAAYFGNARADIVRRLNTDAGSAILEIGCGSGATGRAVLAAGKAGEYVGIELSPAAAEQAAAGLTEVVVANVENLDLDPFRERFDALIASEVLEHLVDPWAALRRLATCLRPGAAVFASSPNIAHRDVLRALARGRFDYEGSGVFDRTHLRWFTPATYREMFEAAGFTVDSVEPLVQPGWKARALNRLFGGRLAHLFAVQIMLVGRRR